VVDLSPTHTPEAGEIALVSGANVNDHVVHADVGLNLEVNPDNLVGLEVVEEVNPEDILNIVVVEVGDFNACVEVPHVEERVLEWDEELYAHFGQCNGEEESFGENNWMQQCVGGVIENYDIGENYQDPYCNMCPSDIEVIFLSDDE
jgi:hypothetical protein